MNKTRIATAAIGSLVLLFLCGIAVTSLLRNASPCSHDGGLHYFRVVALKYTVKRGVLFSRWMPDLAFGYGYPFFNYRAPVPYYLSLGLHLIGFSLPWALNLVYVLSILGSAAGMFLLARDLFGAEAALVASVAYAYAPYQFLDALLRANMPESVALALMPFVLWAFRRLVVRGGRRWFLAAVGSLTVLYLTHNISSLLFTPLLLAYLLTVAWVYPQRGRWTRSALAFGLAVGLTVFFWFPALAERHHVQLSMSRTTRNNDFHYNFLGLAQILAPPIAVDTSLMNPPMHIHQGVVQVFLAGSGFLIGLISTVCRVRNSSSTFGPLRQRELERLISLVLHAAFAVLYVFLSTQASEWVWESVPLLPFVQFPWRFVGRAALPIALLAGASVYYALAGLRGTESARPKRHISFLLPLGLAVLLILSALPFTDPPYGYCPRAASATLRDVLTYEHRSGLVGVDPEGSYFPIWVEQRPMQSPLEDQYDSEGSMDGLPPERFDDTVLPDGAEILEADYFFNRAFLVVESPEPFHARYLSFYFPGWRVKVDGKRVPISPSDPEGLITFGVPAGRHEIDVRFGETPLRIGADALSLLSLLALVVSTTLSPKPDPSTSSGDWRPKILIPRPAILLITGAVLLIFKFAVVDLNQTPTPFRHPSLRADGTLPGVEHPLHQSYGDGLDLIGYDQKPEEMRADDTLRVDLYWTVRKQPSHSYQTVVHVRGPDGLRWSRKDSFRPADYQDPPSTQAWTAGQYALDSHEIEPLPGTPPGRYEIVLTAFERDTLAPLSLLDELGQPAAPELVLDQVTLTAPSQSIDPNHLDIHRRINAHLGPLTLLGAEFDRTQAAPGDPVLVTTFWRAEGRPERDLTLRLALLSAQDSSVAEYTCPPVASWHPTSAWRPGDVWRGQHLIYLPADLDTDAFTWALSVSPSPSYPVHLSQLFVTAPDRSFAQPPVNMEIDTRLGDIATLVGANLEPGALNLKPGTALTTTLVWRAEAETNISHRVFLHLIGPGGALIAQSDAVPDEWTRPTTGWLPGEYIIDVHRLNIPSGTPAGKYTLQAGLYRPEGGRLTTLEGADSVPVTAFPVEAQE